MTNNDLNVSITNDIDQLIENIGTERVVNLNNTTIIAIRNTIRDAIVIHQVALQALPMTEELTPRQIRRRKAKERREKYRR